MCHPWRWFEFELDIPTWSQTHSKHVASQTTSWKLEEAPGLLISWQWLCRSVVAAIQNSGPMGWDPQRWQWNDSLDKLLDQHFIQVHIHTLHPSTFYPNTLYPNNTQTSGINMYIFFMYTYEYVTWHSRESYGITWLYGMNLRIFKTSFMLRSSVKAMRLQWPARTSLMILGRLGFLLLLLLSSLVVGVQPILTGFLHARWKAARFAHRHCEFMRPAAQEIVREGPFIGFQKRAATSENSSNFCRGVPSLCFLS